MITHDITIFNGSMRTPLGLCPDGGVSFASDGSRFLDVPSAQFSAALAADDTVMFMRGLWPVLKVGVNIRIIDNGFRVKSFDIANCDGLTLDLDGRQGNLFRTIECDSINGGRIYLHLGLTSRVEFDCNGAFMPALMIRQMRWREQA